MARTIILLLDSFGIGYAHDAEAYGDKGADTFGPYLRLAGEKSAARRRSADAVAFAASG